MIPEHWQLYKVNYNSAVLGTATWKWGNTAVKTETNVAAPSAGPHTYSGLEYYKGTKDNSLSTADVMYWTIYRIVPTYNNIVFSAALPIPSYTTAATYTYSTHSDNKFAEGQLYIPDPPLYDRDWSRYKLYHKADSSDTMGFTTGMWETDAAFGTSGNGWLQSGSEQRLITDATDGYFLRIAREENGLPVLSQEASKCVFNGVNPAAGVTYLPRRMNFSITNPSDFNSSKHLAYQLTRTDNLGSNVVLGYIKPSNIALSTPNSSNAMTLSNLTSSKTYRLTWCGYLGAQLRIRNPETSQDVTSDAEPGGITITGVSSYTITLVPDGNSWGFDLWVEERVLQPLTNSTAGDVWAYVRAFDGFKYTRTNNTGTNVSATVTASDFLDLFPNGNSAGGINNYVSETEPPTHLKFLKEANNFFFGVGTEATADGRYINATVNKADSYLFISRYNNPRDWPVSGFLEFEDSITGLISYPGEMIVWTANATYRVFGSAHDAMRKVKLPTTEGMPSGNNRTAVLVNNYLVWLSASGICVYDGSNVSNISKIRLDSFDIGNNPHAGQFDGVYFLLDRSETGWAVDTNLEGFPLTRIDLREGGAARSANDPLPALIYRPSINR